MRALFIPTLLALGGCTAIFDWDECGKAADCASGVCADGLCGAPTGPTAAALLANPACHALHPPELADKVGTDEILLFGTLMPITGTLASKGPSREKAIYMAADEINDTGGVRGRKVVLLSCDSGSQAEPATAAAAFMAKTGQVPAIIGASASAATIGAFNEAAREAGVLMISPASTSTLITGVDDDGLLWRTAPSDAGQGIAMGKLIEHLGSAKVAVLSRDDAYGNSLRGTMEDTMCAALDCTDDDVYLTRSYPVNETQTESAHRAALADFEAFAPDVVVVIALADDGVAFMQRVDNSEALRDRPFILSDGVRDQRLVELAHAPLAANLIGFNPAAPTQRPTHRAFVTNYRSKYQSEADSFAAHAYDALYLLAYAAGAQGDGPITGATLARGLTRLSKGDEVKAGPTGFGAAVRTLAEDAAATINFSGASGELDFDPATGEAPGDVAGWKIIGDEIESIGIVYTSADQTFTAPTQ